MECLEDLSLVDDECLEDLKEDIRELIKSYINVEDECIKIFKEIKDKLTVWQIRNITEIFYNVDTFWGGRPLCITKSNWEKRIVDFFDFSDKDERSESIQDIIYAFEKFNKKGKKLDLENDRIWIFRDGANGELWLETENDFLDMMIKQIEWEEKETQLELLRYLKKIQ